MDIPTPFHDGRFFLATKKSSTQNKNRVREAHENIIKVAENHERPAV